MKRSLYILLGLKYFILTIGIAISLHFCQGDLAGINLTTIEACCCGPEEVPSDCCTNNEVQLLFDADQQAPSKIESNWKIFSVDIPGLTDLTSLTTIDIPDSELILFDLPPPDKEPLWLVLCDFTFYG